MAIGIITMLVADITAATTELAIIAVTQLIITTAIEEVITTTELAVGIAEWVATAQLPHQYRSS